MDAQAHGNRDRRLSRLQAQAHRAPLWPRHAEAWLARSGFACNSRPKRHTAALRFTPGSGRSMSTLIAIAYVGSATRLFAHQEVLQSPWSDRAVPFAGRPTPLFGLVYGICRAGANRAAIHFPGQLACAATGRGRASRTLCRPELVALVLAHREPSSGGCGLSLVSTRCQPAVRRRRGAAVKLTLDAAPWAAKRRSA